jgi:eukaryotic-like serine/threonine-protein kinase
MSVRIHELDDPGSALELGASPRSREHDEEGTLVGRNRISSGRYELGEVIGRGGMADVHLGNDLVARRPVAMKILRIDLAKDPQFRSAFQREAQTVARLRHPAIAAVYDTGYHQTVSSGGEVSVPYIVMEYVAGASLRDRLRTGGLAIGQSLRYLVRILSALEFSHQREVVHGDIKPGNVMVTSDGGIKLVDFGLARAIASPAAEITQHHATLGTAAYVSPEQLLGAPMDARSDLYSAGCLLYELLTGRPPFVGANPVSVAYQHVNEEPAPATASNPDLTEAIDAVLLKALAKAPEERFQDARAFIDALRSAAQEIPRDSRDRLTGVEPMIPA